MISAIKLTFSFGSNYKITIQNSQHNKNIDYRFEIFLFCFCFVQRTQFYEKKSNYIETKTTKQKLAVLVYSKFILSEPKLVNAIYCHPNKKTESVFWVCVLKL